MSDKRIGLSESGTVGFAPGARVYWSERVNKLEGLISQLTAKVRELQIVYGEALGAANRTKAALRVAEARVERLEKVLTEIATTDKLTTCIRLALRALGEKIGG